MKNPKFEIQWWDDWYNADSIKKQKMVQNLALIKDVRSLNRVLPEKLFRDSFATFLNSLFEDLANYMHERGNIKKSKGGKQ